MLYPILNSITGELNAFMFEKWGTNANGTDKIVELNNIASINDEKNDLQDKIILTLLKTEEEPALKNGPFYSQDPDDRIKKHHPAIYLNLYLLFSITKKNYKEALQLLSDTLLFFQSRKVFSGPSPGKREGGDFRITFSLYDLPTQEVFELWSNLGNKQYPFVLYKARVIRVIDPDRFETVHTIQTTKVLNKSEEL